MNITVNVKNILSLSVLLFVCTSCPLSGGRDCVLRITATDSRALSVRVEIADTDPLRMKGLMNRKNLGRDSGMLFVFERESRQNFWMKNTYIPLSIAYIGTDGTINEIYDMKPLDTSVTYPSSLPARYALEVNRGWFEKNAVTRGCRILFDGCLGK